MDSNVRHDIAQGVKSPTGCKVSIGLAEVHIHHAVTAAATSHLGRSVSKVDSSKNKPEPHLASNRAPAGFSRRVAKRSACWVEIELTVLIVLTTIDKPLTDQLQPHPTPYTRTQPHACIRVGMS